MSARWRESTVEADDGTRLYVRQRDGRQPLTAVLCDGIACDGFIWRYLADDMAAIARVVHWNYRGHGRSGAPVDADRINLEAFIDDLERVRHARVDGPALLVGHSMGCQIALEGYRRRPDGVAGLVLVCGTFGRMTHTFKGSDALARALPRLIARMGNQPRLARALWSHVPPVTATRLALATGEVADSIRPEDLTAYMEHAANLDPLMFLRMLQSIGEETAEDLLPDVAVPVLVIAGELDGFTPPHLAEQMAASIPDSELMMVSGATHVVPIERHEEVAERIADFVARRVLPRLA
jgi:pimeloyl-ACP methyl ester carboxylesterase